MKITDKERLDWCQRNPYTMPYMAASGRWYVEKKIGQRDTFRQAIDAAIRAGERNKI